MSPILNQPFIAILLIKRTQYQVWLRYEKIISLQYIDGWHKELQLVTFSWLYYLCSNVSVKVQLNFFSYSYCGVIEMWWLVFHIEDKYAFLSFTNYDSLNLFYYFVKLPPLNCFSTFLTFWTVLGRILWKFCLFFIFYGIWGFGFEYGEQYYT